MTMDWNTMSGSQVPKTDARGRALNLLQLHFPTLYNDLKVTPDIKDPAMATQRRFELELLKHTVNSFQAHAAENPGFQNAQEAGAVNSLALNIANKYGGLDGHLLPDYADHLSQQIMRQFAQTASSNNMTMLDISQGIGNQIIADRNTLAPLIDQHLPLAKHWDNTGTLAQAAQAGHMTAAGWQGPSEAIPQGPGIHRAWAYHVEGETPEQSARVDAVNAEMLRKEQAAQSTQTAPGAPLSGGMQTASQPSFNEERPDDLYAHGPTPNANDEEAGSPAQQGLVTGARAGALGASPQHSLQGPYAPMGAASIGAYGAEGGSPRTAGSNAPLPFNPQEYDFGSMTAALQQPANSDHPAYAGSQRPGFWESLRKASQFLGSDQDSSFTPPDLFKE